jgi:hypothetical protein
MEHTSSSHHEVHIHDTRKVSVWAYWPIAGIYLLSFLFALYTVQFQMYPDYMSHVMGFVLVLFGLIKVTDVFGFAKGFAMYDPLAKKSATYAQVYPFLEITLGVLFILQLLILPATLLTLAIYSSSLYGAVQSLRKQEELHCVCLGTYFKLPLSTVTILEAGFMIVMCVWMLLMINTMVGMAM